MKVLVYCHEPQFGVRNHQFAETETDGAINSRPRKSITNWSPFLLRSGKRHSLNRHI